MAKMHVPTVIRELLELTGWPQHRLAKKLGVTQGTISKWLNSDQDPSKTQWERVVDFYFELKGWRRSLDEKVADYDDETQDYIHDLVDRILKTATRRDGEKKS